MKKKENCLDYFAKGFQLVCGGCYLIGRPFLWLGALIAFLAHSNLDFRIDIAFLIVFILGMLYDTVMTGERK